MSSTNRLDIRTKIQQVRGIYDASAKSRKGHFLILAEKGMGKTKLLETCPKPVLIHSFDPDGTSVIDRALIEAGKVIIDNRFEDDQYDNPKAYMLWQEEFNEWKNGNLFKDIGTYALDSTTTLASCMIWQIMKKEGRTIPPMNVALDQNNKGMRQVDWNTVLTMFINITRALVNLPCHTVMCGHIGRDKDAVTQGYIRTIMLPGQSSDQVPVLVPEMLVLRKKQEKRYLLTQDDAEYKAVTRMGAGKWDKEEQPNIQQLLKKAGKDWEDVVV